MIPPPPPAGENPGKTVRVGSWADPAAVAVLGVILLCMVAFALFVGDDRPDPVLRDCVLRRSDAGVFVDCTVENGDRVTYRVEEER